MREFSGINDHGDVSIHNNHAFPLKVLRFLNIMISDSIVCRTSLGKNHIALFLYMARFPVIICFKKKNRKI